MTFKFDENNTGFEPIKAGEYEVYMNTYTLKTAKSGNEMIEVNYTIRPDVDQPAKNQEIRFDNFVITENSIWRIHALSKAVGVPSGYDFGTPQGWAQAMLGKPVKVKVGLREHNGNEYADVKGFMESEYKEFKTEPVIKKEQNQNNQQSSNPFANANGPIDISDDDLPF